MRGGFGVPRTATLPARRNFGQEDRRGVPKPASKRTQVLTRLPTRPAQFKLPRIHPSNEPAIQRAIVLVEGRWRIAILCQLQDGPVRVGELKRRMRPISKKVLNQHLRRMEKEGLVIRTEIKGKIPHVEYALTNLLGCSILGLLQAIAQWSSQNIMGSASLPAPDNLPGPQKEVGLTSLGPPYRWAQRGNTC